MFIIIDIFLTKLNLFKFKFSIEFYNLYKTILKFYF